jgi:hypothetical protein
MSALQCSRGLAGSVSTTETCQRDRRTFPTASSSLRNSSPTTNGRGRARQGSNLRPGAEKLHGPGRCAPGRLHDESHDSRSWWEASAGLHGWSVLSDRRVLLWKALAAARVAQGHLRGTPWPGWPSAGRQPPEGKGRHVGHRTSDSLPGCPLACRIDSGREDPRRARGRARPAPARPGRAVLISIAGAPPGYAPGAREPCRRSAWNSPTCNAAPSCRPTSCTAVDHRSDRVAQ